MKLIPLTKGKFAKVDDADFERVSQYSWSAYKSGNTYYAQTTINKENRTIKLHRFILGLTDASVLIDHKDNDGLNCQRYNMRIANSSQNNANRRPKAGKKYLGVHHRYNVIKGKKVYGNSWIAICKKDGVVHKRTCLKSEKSAAIAYNEMAKNLHGPFARLNTIE